VAVEGDRAEGGGEAEELCICDNNVDCRSCQPCAQNDGSSTCCRVHVAAAGAGRVEVVEVVEVEVGAGRVERVGALDAGRVSDWPTVCGLRRSATAVVS